MLAIALAAALLASQQQQPALSRDRKGAVAGTTTPLPSRAKRGTTEPSTTWDNLKFLLGDWTAEGGSFTLHPDLDRKILVRKNISETRGARHEDLMVIYPATADATLHAIYWDNEGHVINYKITANSRQAVFLSEAETGPRYRLTYENAGPATVNIKFEVAPPGKDFRLYLQAPAHRR